MKIKFPRVHLLAQAVVMAAVSSKSVSGQIPTTPVLHVNTSLALVDVVADYQPVGLHTRELLTGLQRNDFLLFDDGKEVPVVSFDTGVDHTTRPIALWLVVQCSEGLPIGFASMFWRGRVQLLLPALKHLKPEDSVGVAHWCDTGDAHIDLSDSHDLARAVQTTERVLQAAPPKGLESRKGELAMQRLVENIVSATKTPTPSRLPVLLFLYGDEDATYYDEAANVLKSVLETSGVVFGINDGSVPYTPGAYTTYTHQLRFLAHFYSIETGGEFYSTPDPKLFANALDYILSQMHLRYTLGFKPEVRDGKRHTLSLRLSENARERYGAVELRYRREYIPLASTQTDQH